MKGSLAQILQGKVVIVGIGNIMRGDDGFGPELVKRVRDSIKAVCFDAGTAPENWAEKIVKEEPATILIIDAVSLGRNPGEYEIFKGRDIVKSGFTTHDISPSMFIDYLRQRCHAEIYMLGAQPKSLEFGEDFSVEIKKTLDDLEKILKEALHA